MNSEDCEVKMFSKKIHCVLIFVLGFAMVACGSKDSDKNGSSSTPLRTVPASNDTSIYNVCPGTNTQCNFQGNLMVTNPTNFVQLVDKGTYHQGSGHLGDFLGSAYDSLKQCETTLSIGLIVDILKALLDGSSVSRAFHGSKYNAFFQCSIEIGVLQPAENYPQAYSTIYQSNYVYISNGAHSMMTGMIHIQDAKQQSTSIQFSAVPYQSGNQIWFVDQSANIAFRYLRQDQMTVLTRSVEKPTWANAGTITVQRLNSL